MTRQGLIDAMNSTTDFTGDGMVPPCDFSKPSAALGGKAPRVVNDGIILADFVNGKEVPQGGGKFVHTLGLSG